ncbi:aerotolerance regulator BatA [bacterium DOLJORAL78_65_58]|nr:MAG: aerotolerance regulator BatA [bacterium DOLJORAL78_65_58]
MEFARPLYLLLILPVAALLIWRLRAGREPGALRHAHLALMPVGDGGGRLALARLMPWLSALAVLLLLVALAGPRIAHRSEEVEGEGIDIVLSLDISGSMRSLDFEPDDRLGAAKKVIRGFVEGRSHDRIGLVVFAQKAFTQCPLHSDSPSRTIILLTDGANNVPTLEPETAVEMAKSLDIRVYTVAIGKEGLVPYPVDDPIFGRRVRQVENKLDTDLLRKIAADTGGQMFQATDPEALEKIFETIDELETARYKTVVSTWYRELMPLFAVPALLLLLAEGLLTATWLRRLP